MMLLYIENNYFLSCTQKIDIKPYHIQYLNSLLLFLMHTNYTMLTFKSHKNQEELAPYTLYVADSFKISELANAIQSHIKATEKYEFLIKTVTNHILLRTHIKAQLKKNTSSYIQYDIETIEKGIQITSKEVFENHTDHSEKVTHRVLSKKDIGILSIVTTYVNSPLDDGGAFLNAGKKNEYTVSLTPEAKNCILYHLSDAEWVLSCLSITNVKSEDHDINNKAECFLVLTTTRTLLFVDDSPVYSIVDLSEIPLTYEEKLGKDHIDSEKISFDTTVLNDSLMESIEPCITGSTEDRVSKFADILFLKLGSKANYQPWIIKLYQKAGRITNALVNEVKSILVTVFADQKYTTTHLPTQKLEALLYSQKDFGLMLYTMSKDWELSSVVQCQFLNHFTTTYTSVQLLNLSVYYDSVMATIATEKKQPEDWFTMQLQHVAYLKETAQYEKAIPFYEYLIEQLTDDTILPLLSNQYTNLFLGEDVNPIRIEVLEALLVVKRKAGVSYTTEILMLATLQPLVFDRLLYMIEEGVEVDKANHILSLFQKDILMPEETRMSSGIVQEYTKQTLVDLVTPVCFKETKGYMDQFRQMVAQITPPDYGQVIAFSEGISMTNYPSAYEIIVSTAKRLGIQTPECYLGRGDFETGIIGVEGTPNFLIIGTAHLEDTHSEYLSLSELQFLIAVEMAHIVFEHTPITSKDVWRGAKNKGMNIAEVLLVALPILSSVGTVASKFVNVSKLTSVFNGVEKITNVVDKGQSAISYGEKINDKLNLKTKDSDLLATSRLMEISADRVGLLMNMDLKSSIAAMFKIEPIYEKVQDQIRKEGLQAVLETIDDEERFIYQEYTIRLKTLCSFYLAYEGTIRS